MDALTFIIAHHSTNDSHINLLVRCIESIRLLYNKNKIIISKTSTSIIPNDILSKYDNIIVKNIMKDGLHIYGAIEILINIEDINNFIILHDSMVLLNKLPNDILNKRFYFLWHFDKFKEDLSYTQLIDYLNDTVFEMSSKNEIIKNYNNMFAISWFGLFGPAFGGSIDNLRQLWNVLNINQDNCDKYLNRTGIIAAERYISLICNKLGIIDTFEKSYSLNGLIHSQPYAFNNSLQNLSLEVIIKNYKNYGYFFKTWIGR